MDSEPVEAVELVTATQTEEEKSDSHATDKAEDPDLKLDEEEAKDTGNDLNPTRTTTHMAGEAKTTLRQKLDDQVQVTGQVLDQLRDEQYSKGECLCFFSLLIVFTVMAVLATDSN